MTTLQKILDCKIVAILRGVDPEQVPAVAAALGEGGIQALEITLNSKGALDVIRKLSAQTGDRMLIGAGTVLDADAAISAIDAGARFIISPSLDIPTIQMTRQLGAVSMPGAFTATEILTAFRNGADVIKVFPASVGVGYFRDLRGPLSHIPLMPTGGVNLENIRDFRMAGAVAFGIGSALVDPKEAVTDDYLRRLTDLAKQYVSALNS